MVKGTISVVIATLMGLEWEPRTLAHSVNTDGEEFHNKTCDQDRLLVYAFTGGGQSAGLGDGQ